MAKIIPTPNQRILSRMTSGEKRFAKRINDLLEDDYLCWYDIPVGKNRRYPDFILLHPSRGLLFIEVKDWKPETIKKISKERVELQTAQGRKTVANPFEQVRQCTYQTINLLQKDPLLRQNTKKYFGNLVTPYAWGVVFSNIHRNQIEKAIPEEHRASLLPDHLCIYKDEMTESVDAEDFQNRLWSMFSQQFPDKLSLPQIDRIRWHLFPEIRIDAPVQSDLFKKEDTEETSEHITENIPDLIKIMDIQQEQLARSLGEGHRVIHGVAGSGKTLILGYRAQVLAEASSQPILILCFNVSLAAKLRNFIEAKGLSSQIDIYHFHDWCLAQLATFNVDVIEGDAPIWERHVSTVIEAVEKTHIPRGQYGAVLIDEGHDFEADWLKLIAQMVNPETNSLLLLYDDAQSIYKKDKGLGFTLSSVGIQAQGRTSILRLNYRNTREILTFAYRFVSQYIDENNQSQKNLDIPVIKPEAAGLRGKKPKIHALGNWHDELAHCVHTIKKWRSDGVALKDIGVIYVAGFQGKALSKAYNIVGIPHLWMASKQYKQAYDPSIDRVSLLTIHSSKGLEFSHVILVGINSLSNDETHQDARLLYVGMTRAQNELSVCYSGENALYQKLTT